MTTTFLDKLIKTSPLVRHIAQRGNCQPFNGGLPIIEALSFTQQPQIPTDTYTGTFTGCDTAQSDDVISGAQFDCKKYAAPATYSSRDEAIGGAPEHSDLWNARVSAAEWTIVNMVAQHLMLDGKGNNGKEIDGIAALAPINPKSCVYGGISARHFSFWQSQSLVSKVTSKNIRREWGKLMRKLTRGTDSPDLIIAGSESFALFQNATTKPASKFKGAMVYMDENIDPDATYFLNTNYLKLRYHKDRNGVLLQGLAHSVNADARVENFIWEGNLTCSGRRYQGVHFNI